MILAGSVCVASAGNIWYRVSVEEIDEETGIYLVKFLDYGGRASVEYTQLRQIREDFLTLPFQAAECMLANIETTEGNRLSMQSGGKQLFVLFYRKWYMAGRGICCSL